jgi:NhaP-type Na+/H+ or K+/H+ antiporter
MTHLQWLLAIGVLLVVTSVASGWIRRGPITSFAVYLVAGVIAGPAVLGVARVAFDTESADWLRMATETGLVVSLFITGLKLRVPFRHVGWRTAWRLAIPAMVLTVGMLAIGVRWAFGWPWPVALLLGAILAPTDPVLASLVSVDDARDDDAMRVSLSGEAGLNDGTALPLLLLALALLSGSATGTGLWAHWIGIEVIWGCLAGAALGFAVGWGVGLIGTHLRHAVKDVAPGDFLALGIIVLAYAGSELVHASGFLAAFAAGVGLRRVEVRVSRQHTDEEGASDGHDFNAPAELNVRPNERSSADNVHPAQTVGWVLSDALSFGDTVERLIGAALIFLVGIAAVPALTWAGVGVSAGLLLLIRPVSVWVSTVGLKLPWQRRLLLGWFGIRGLGSLNYLAYALTHGFGGKDAEAVSAIVLAVVATSVLLHGVSTTPLMAWRQRALERKHRTAAS